MLFSARNFGDGWQLTGFNANVASVSVDGNWTVSGRHYGNELSDQWKDFKIASLAPLTYGGLAYGVLRGGNVSVSENGFDISNTKSDRTFTLGMSVLYGGGQSASSLNYPYDGGSPTGRTVGEHESVHRGRHYPSMGAAFPVIWALNGMDNKSNPFEMDADYGPLP
jgi:hypothetical protein